MHVLFLVTSKTCLTRNVKVVGSSPIKVPRCVIEQETFTLIA